VFERAQWQQPTLLSFSMMMFLGVFCSVVAYLLYNRGLTTMAPSTVTSMLNSWRSSAFSSRGWC
jgi:drug/metabolite transporter (DMT)-like permease